MGSFNLRAKKPTIAAVIAPFVLAVAAFSTPVLSDTSEKFPQMTFDSIGSMLQDMNREHAQADMTDYTLSPATAHGRDKACKDEARARTRMTAEQIQATIDAMEEQWMNSVLIEEDTVMEPIEAPVKPTAATIASHP